MSDEERNHSHARDLPTIGDLLRWAEQTQRTLDLVLQQQAEFQTKSEADRQRFRELYEQNEERWARNEARWAQNDERWARNEKRWTRNEELWTRNEELWTRNEERWARNEERWIRNNEQWTRNEEHWVRNEERWVRNEERWVRNEKRWVRMSEEIRSLLAIAEMHDAEGKELRRAQAESQARADARFAETGERVDALVNTVERLISERHNGGGKREESSQ